MPLPQAQFIQPNVGDHTLGIDLSILGQLILDDPVYRLGRDSQATGNLLRRAADQRAEHELLEAISVGYVLAFERGDNVLPVVTPRTAMEGSLVNPETGLLPQVEVPDRLGACFELDVGDVVVATFFGSSVFKCKTSRIGPSGPWPSGGCARSSSRSLATPDSSPGSVGPTDSSLTSVHRYAW